jgi:chitin synthase
VENKELAAATFATISRANSLTRKIDAAETILEAFGHAWSRSSPNSSRYSRYTELQFDKRGKLIGCKVLDYLLEKSRVSGKFSLGEANYHIFYYLLAGANTEEKLDWSLDEASSFNYLGFPPNGKSYASPFTNIVSEIEGQFLFVLINVINHSCLYI